ncbi:MAG: hypothetical protein VW298_01120 [Candidatus Woesearchaeota archaeon]
MENLVRKTMTAFLVLLTLMIPVSAATEVSTPSIAAIENGDDTFTVSFTYTGVTTAETLDLTVSGTGVATQTQTVSLSPVAAGGNGVASATFVAGTVANGATLTFAVSNGNNTGVYTDLNGSTVNITVNPETVDELEANLVADNDYEDEVSPGDTIVLELELENGNTIYNDVSLEAYLIDGNGLRVSDIQETGDFNLGVEEEEVVTMEFDVEEDLDEGTYQIYVVATSDEGTLFEETYGVTVERDEHSLVVTDLRVSNAAAGETVDVAVTILNNGQTDEDDVLVSLSVAGQTVTSDYFTVEEDEELVRYFTLTLPSGASGNELVTVAVANEDVSVSSSTTVNVEARNQAASLTEEQVAALLEARLNQGNNNGFDDLSLGWLVAGLLVVYLLVSNRGLMPTTSRAASTSSRGRRSSKKYY